MTIKNSHLLLLKPSALQAWRHILVIPAFSRKRRGLSLVLPGLQSETVSLDYPKPTKLNQTHPQTTKLTHPKPTKPNQIQTN